MVSYAGIKKIKILSAGHWFNNGYSAASFLLQSCNSASVSTMHSYNTYQNFGREWGRKLLATGCSVYKVPILAFYRQKLWHLLKLVSELLCL